MDRKEWLKSLKAGDKVVTLKRDKGNPDFYSYYELLEIKNITNKGNIMLTNGVLLDETGYYCERYDWPKAIKIEPITQEVLDHGRKKLEYKLQVERVEELCNNFNARKHSPEDLEILEDIFMKIYSKR